MIKPNKWDILLFLAIMIGLLAFFIIGYKMGKSDIITLSSLNSYSNCSNLSLENSARCLQSELVKFYRYNISQYNKDITFEELNQSGGVCDHYASWYQMKASNLGFQAKKIDFRINLTNGHAIAIMADNSGYCLLDQQRVNCWEFG